MSKIEEIKARWVAAHAGPWKWMGAPGRGFYLATAHSGAVYVMGFNRMGLHGAQPIFQPGKNGMVPAKDLCIFEVCRDAETADDPRVYRRDIVGFRAPDAVAIAAAPEDVGYLLTRCTALEALAVGLAKAMEEADGCIAAAYAEGLSDRINEADASEPGSLAGLVVRRIAPISGVLNAALASPLLAELLGSGAGQVAMDTPSRDDAIRCRALCDARDAVAHLISPGSDPRWPISPASVIIHKMVMETDTYRKNIAESRYRHAEGLAALVNKEAGR